MLKSRFRLFPAEWDSQQETVVPGNSGMERQAYLQSVKTGLDIELRRINELIRLLEKKSDYTVDKLAGLYRNSSLNGYFLPFIAYVVKNLNAGNRRKTATILLTAKTSFERFLCGQDIPLDRIDNDLMRKYEHRLKTAGVMNNTVSCYMRALRSVYNQAVKQGLTTQKNPFAGIFTRIDRTAKRAVNEDVIIRLKNMDLS
ncbi:MAG: phage integrase SAM-like domain-containing protein, partial [Tannerella sp.]|nr:phage integrase SAM-like domain-containing protein [Tannerella sp.]